MTLAPPPIPQTPFSERRSWLWGTTALAAGVISIHLLFLIDHAGAKIVEIFADPIFWRWGVGGLGYSLLTGLRWWAARRWDSPRRAVVPRLISLLFWGATIPLVWWSGLLLLFWNGVPG